MAKNTGGSIDAGAGSNVDASAQGGAATTKNWADAMPPEVAAEYRELIAYMNDTGVVLSCLYDTNLMPEQLEKGSYDWVRMVGIISHFRDYRDELLALRKPPSVWLVFWGRNYDTAFATEKEAQDYCEVNNARGTVATYEYVEKELAPVSASSGQAQGGGDNTTTSGTSE